VSRPPAAPGGLAGRGVAYWKERARALGEHAVLSTDHAAADIDEVSAAHRAHLLPALVALLPFAPGPARTALDLGCGSGRLTADLAAVVGGRAIGLDPVGELLDRAPRTPDVEYRGLVPGAPLPLADGAVDLVFTCLVLGGIDDEALAALGHELERVLAPGGLLVFAESVSDRPAVEHWTFRAAADYAAAMPWAGLREAARFDDAGDPVSVLTGRRGA
jgi:SAM-dependent methyltransferase